MNIGIYSINTCYNYGALLQCWSLQQAVLSITDEKVFHIEISQHNKYINYIKPLVKPVLKKLKRNQPKHNYKVNLRQQVAKEFKDTLLPTQVFQNWKDIDTNNVSGIIIGSDEVLNPGQHTTDLMRGILPLGMSVPISGYAMSLGSPDNIEKCLLAGFNAYGFQNVAVRDHFSSDLFSRFNRDSKITLDPIFLPSELQFSSLYSRFDQDSSVEEYKTDPYILVYSDWNCKELIDYLSKLGLTSRFVILGNLNSDQEQRESDPNNSCIFLEASFPINKVPGLIKDSQGVITNFFHGIAFSTRYKRPFHFLIAKENTCKINKSYKVNDLLNNLGLSGFVENGKHTFPSIENSNDWINIYHQAWENIEVLKNSSVSYLEEVIELMP